MFGYAAAHFQEPLSLTDLARSAAMSPPGFSRYFKKATGRTPSDFINDIRIQHASELLRDTSRTVLDIAGESGFPTLTNFNRQFRQRTGTSPRDYRRTFQVSTE